MASDGPFILYFLLTIFYGLVNSFTSPAFPDLKTQTVPPLSAAELGTLFVYRGVGSMAGAFMVGAALDQLDSSECWKRRYGADPLSSTHFLLALCISFRVISSWLMPLGTSETAIGMNLAALAFQSNAIYVCGSSGVSKTYGKLLGPRVSLMDAAFGVGGIFAPLLAKTVDWVGYNSAVVGYRVLAIVDLGLLAGTVSLLFIGGGDNETDVGVHQDADSGETKKLLEAGEPSGAEETSEDLVDYTAVLINCVLTFSVDVCFASAVFWCFAYASQALKLSKDSSDVINAALWLVFTSVQFLWAYLQSHYPERWTATNILKLIMPWSFLMGLSMAVSSHLDTSLPAIFLVLLGLGGGMNALFTAILRQRTTISGKAFGLLRVSSACGNMFGGALVGWFESIVGLALALPVVEASGMGLAMIVFWGCGKAGFTQRMQNSDTVAV